MEKNIKVCVRFRPLLLNQVMSDAIKVNPEENCIMLGNSCYNVDKVFDETSNNDDIYKYISSDNITQLFNGFNISIIAYGTTGTGKSFTIGTQSRSLVVSEYQNLGIIPRLVQELFLKKQEVSENVTFEVSFIELYKDTMHDLISPTTSSYNFKGGTDLKAFKLTCSEIANSNEAISILKKGILKRKTASLKKNNNSSRSHAIFTIHLLQKYGGGIKRSKILVCDLAGSERMDPSKTNQQAVEGININMGLTALKTVITQLSTIPLPKHISYRDSSLTKLLEDSLGGNCMTTFISCISRAGELREAKRTLEFSVLSRNIKNTVSKNIELTDVKALIEENKNLKQKLEETVQNFGSFSDANTNFQAVQEFLVKRQSDLKEVAKKYKATRHIKPTLSKLKSFLTFSMENENIQTSEEVSNAFANGISNLNWLEELMNSIDGPLTNIAQSPVEREDQQSQYLSESMTEEYLLNLEDSLIDDEEKDPLYRATPVYKQRKRKIQEDQTASTSTLKALLQPKYLRVALCSCPEDCEENSCKCKEHGTACHKQCNCHKCMLRK